jgi:hypothetical protein
VVINLQPTTCNICKSRVEFVSNAKIYGREYGSGKCYLCTGCRAYVGTHKPRPTEAFGILADADMRAWKQECHRLFDSLWESAKGKNRHTVRNGWYGWLAKELGIPKEECHFGYFDLPLLIRSYEILKRKTGEWT